MTWANQLVNSAGDYVPHLLAVDPTLHWANPGGGTAKRDSAPTNTFDAAPYIPTTDIPPIWNDIYYGDTITVNGNTWPNLNVEPRRYRFRILNACAVRPLTLKVVSSLTAATPASSALPLYVIGSDGGFLPRVVELSGTTGLPVLPAERTT